MELDEPWGRIVAWLDEHAPGSAARLRPPAPPEELAAARAGFARPWPRDLVRFYELSDGVDDSFRAPVIPMSFGPLPVTHLAERTRSHVEVFTDLHASGDLGEDWPSTDEAEGMLAGTTVWQWIPSYVRFADDSMGHAIVVDLRGGPQSGSVFEWMHEGADDSRRRPSLTLLLDEVATCLEDGVAFDGSWLATVDDDGRLHWDLDRS